MLSQDTLDGVVGLQGNSLLVDLAVTSLEDESSDGFSGWVSVGDVWLNSSEHIDGSLIDSDEDTVVELSQSEESHDPDDLGVEFVNTSDSNNKGEFGFSSYVNLSSEFSLSGSKFTFLMAAVSALTEFW